MMITNKQSHEEAPLEEFLTFPKVQQELVDDHEEEESLETLTLSAPLEEFPTLPKVQQELVDDHEEEESLETLSLSDLPIYSNNSSDWEKYLAKEYQPSSISSSSSLSSSNQDYFEFFSEEWNSPNPSYPPDNIVFCGKLLVPSEQHSSDSSSQKPENENNPTIRDKKRCFFRWKYNVSVHKSKKSTSRKLSSGVFDGDNVKNLNKNKAKLLNSKSFPVQGNGCRRKKKEFSAKRRVSSSMFMFGLARVPSDLMELSDIRSRQSRRIPLMAYAGAEEVAVCRRSGKGLWSLVRALCCGGDHLVKASFGCNIPLV